LSHQFLVGVEDTRTCEDRFDMESKRSRYKRAVPRAFSLPSTSTDDSAAWTCFTYTIRFQNFKPGTDPMQHSASDFLLLSPQLLDEEASNICVHLNLPAFASVESKFAYCGVLDVSHEKVNLHSPRHAQFPSCIESLCSIIQPITAIVEVYL
jgi:hypothetical protein